MKQHAIGRAANTYMRSMVRLKPFDADEFNDVYKHVDNTWKEFNHYKFVNVVMTNAIARVEKAEQDSDEYYDHIEYIQEYLFAVDMCDASLKDVNVGKQLEDMILKFDARHLADSDSDTG